MITITMDSRKAIEVMIGEKIRKIDGACVNTSMSLENTRGLLRLTVSVNDENNCPYRKEPDSILHTFVECH